MDVQNWLEQLELDEYIESFQANAIDEHVLLDLIAEDLRDLGVSKVGHRRKLLTAIAALSGDHAKDTQVVANTPSKTTETITAKIRDTGLEAEHHSVKSEAERRHLTVMFVDMVGSTELSTQIDAEEVRDVITGFQNTVAGVIGRFEGFVARFMGDGVLCYFGWPRANEDDAERAVRAGLSIIESVKKNTTPAGTPLSTRIGIASGMVIVGDLIGSGASEEAAVVGETPNLAARLQSLAGPDQLVLPGSTHKLLNNVFTLESSGLHSLKGISDPVEAFIVMGEVERESRFEARNTAGMTPLVGRSQELDLIREGWTQAMKGSGQMILVSGEAGIGKSRITQAAIEEVKKSDHIRITFQCSPYHKESAFYPIIHQMQYAAGITSADTVEERLAKLQVLPGIDIDNLPLLAAMLGIDPDAGYTLPELTPVQLRAHTLEALVDTLMSQADDKPLLVVFEDLHWIDPTTLEFLDLAVDAIGQHKILILSTTRPSFEHSFGGHPDVSRFALNRLGRKQVLSIIAKLTEGKSFPEDVLQIIIERTDGVPLYVEELTKTIIESGMLKKNADDEYFHEGPLHALAIPNSLHDSLMARLDRLQPIKEVAQTAACIGREFHHHMLAKVSPLNETQLNSALDGLISAELIYRRGVAPEARYLFKHALVRDAAYESLLKPRRRSIHAAILQALENESGLAPEILATHAEAAGLTERAIDLWEAASKVAVARPAFDEGITHLTHAIQLITPQINTGDITATNKALGLQVQLGVALMARKGWGAIETKTAFQGALTLADKVGETPLRFSILYGLMTARYLRGDIAEAVHHGKEFVDLAEKAKNAAPAAVANRSYGCALMFSGKLDDAQHYFDRALELFDPVEHAGLAKQYGQDLGVGSTALYSYNLLLRGESRRAKQAFQDCEQYAADSKHVFSIGYMHLFGLMNSVLARDDAELNQHATALSLLAAEHKLSLFSHLSALGIALLMIERGKDAAHETFQEADRAMMAMGSKTVVAMMRIEAGYRWLTCGNSTLADEYIAQSPTLIEENGEYYPLSDLYRLEAARACVDSKFDKAEQLLQQAVDVALEHGARLYGLRAALDYARLLNNQKRKAEAIAVLKPAYNEIADGDLPREKQEAADMLGSQST